METSRLIEAIVEEMAVLIVELAGFTEARAPLTRVGDVLFLKLADELESRGVKPKAAAASLGLGLRAFQKKLRRHQPSETDGRSLWQAIAGYVISEGRVRREDVLRRFGRDDMRSVTAVLIDLVKDGKVRAHGRGATSVYEGVEQAHDDDRDTLELLAIQIWGSVDRAPGTREEVLSRFFRVADAEAVLDQLVADGRITSVDEMLLATEHVPAESSQGFEPAVISHVRAMSRAIVAKLRSTRDEAPVTGTTVAFEVHPEHPNREEVLALAASIQSSIRELWDRVNAYNFAHPADPHERVFVYVGQVVDELSQD